MVINKMILCGFDKWCVSSCEGTYCFDRSFKGKAAMLLIIYSVILFVILTIHLLIDDQYYIWNIATLLISGAQQKHQPPSLFLSFHPLFTAAVGELTTT